MKSLSNTPELFADPQNKERVNDLLWKLFKTWVIDQETENSASGRKEMLDFYEDLKMLLEAVYAPEPVIEPEPFPEEIRTIETYFMQLIEALKILVDPEMIFLFDLPNLGHLDVSHRREIYVVIKNQDLEEHHNTIGLFSFLSSGKQEFAIHSINRNHLTSVLGKGHLFFQYHIRHLHLIYRKQGVPDLKEIPHERLEERMLNLKPNLEKNWEKADLFWKHALQEQDNLNWESSLFFLHQALELRLRALILVWEKRELKSHETRVLLRECYQFIPELSSVFPQNTEEEVQLLQLLEDAYCKVRYRTEFPVEEKLSRTLSSRIAQVRSLCNKHYEHFFQPL
ncbi:HEPN domain-containing protein [Algoriphagus locisalis]|uniref:HEPN domain-containing protein n=1 Tax=Algoriphagus locisalis TaxID=305507 RepID=A0A1I7BPS7_9BACT|nr:HEPN domain-containing protein [Algoriphagus locisalis]SFT89185.1 HEPN domain-containing protein [Algoriphagus locisalis]